MTYEFRMPDIGEGIAEVEIIEWLVPLGAPVAEDQPVVTIETDKARVDIPTPAAGTMTAFGAEPGTFIAVGSVLFTLDGAAGAPAAADPARPANDEQPAPPNDRPPPAPTPAAAGTGSRPKAAPSVRRLADEHGLDLASVAGTGPGGRILKADVLRAAAGTPADRAPAAQPASRAAAATDATPRRSAAADPFDVTIPLRGLRRSIAKNMSQSWRTVPHITDWRAADATNLIAARNALRAANPDFAAQLTYLPLLLKIVATALAANPVMNASVDADEEGYVLHSRINLGIATSTPDGLLVPVVRDADRKSVLELAVETAELIELTRTRKASTEQLTGGTYTVNNIGALGGTMGSPIIRPPEVGILGFGRIADTVVARDGQPVVRPMMTLSSVGDHRLHDGNELSAFTGLLVELIENPVRLLGTLR